MTLDIFLHVLMRFIHISSVILFLGGVVYSRQIFFPTLTALRPGEGLVFAKAAQLRYRGTLFTLLGLIVVSGLYNLLAGPKHQYAWQMWFGIKMLLVLHVLATAILWSTAAYKDEGGLTKAKRRLVSLGISGLLIVLISAYLRSLTQRGL